MKKKLAPYLIFTFSVILATFFWEKININQFNDLFRFIFFLIFPTINILIFFFIKKNTLFANLKLIFFQKKINFKTYTVSTKTKYLSLTFYFFILIILIEFFSIDFSDYNFGVDLFHDGMALSASENAKLSQGFWSTSYITRGFFADFIPFLLWKFTKIETIGVTRIFSVFLILFNKILLILISRELSLLVNLERFYKIIFFILLATLLLSFTSYGEPIFIKRTLLLLIYIYIFLKYFFSEKKFLYYLIISLISSLSFFWYIDIAIYINSIFILLIIWHLIKKEFQSVAYLSIFYIFTLCLVVIIFPSFELIEFFDNSKNILLTLNSIHEITYPTPFFSLDARSTRALLIFLVTIFILINSLNKKIENKDIKFFFSMFFLIIVGLLYFNYALSRSDSVHIKIGQSFILIPFFSLLLLNVIKYFSSWKNLIKNYRKHISLILLLLFGVITIFFNKKYENKSLANLNTFSSSIKKILFLEDKNFVDNKTANFLEYYKKLIKDEKCTFILTNEVAFYYFLKKQSCSKYYFLWVSNLENIQNKIVYDIYQTKPRYLIYSSKNDIFKISDKDMHIVKNFVDINYSIFNILDGWIIYKLNE